MPRNCWIFSSALLSLVGGIAFSRPLAAQFPYRTVPRTEIDTPFCYMETKDGHILVLDALCRKNNVPVTLSKDQVFIQHYKRLAAQDPELSNILTAAAQNNPGALINTAKLFCEGLQAGISLQELRSARDLGAEIDGNPYIQKANKVSSDILAILAAQYYCPNFQ